MCLETIFLESKGHGAETNKSSHEKEEESESFLDKVSDFFQDKQASAPVSMLRFGLKQVGLVDDIKESKLHSDDIQKNAELCSTKEKLRPYLRKLERGEYPKGLKEAIGKVPFDKLQVAKHYCKLKNNIPTSFPEKFRSLDPRSREQKNLRYPSGVFTQDLPGGEWPDDHLKKLHGNQAFGQTGGHGFQSTSCKSCHERQYSEWSSSAHARAAVDVGFNLFEKSLRELNLNTAHGGFGADGNEEPTTQFCVRCHVGTGFESRTDLGPVPSDSQNFVKDHLSAEETRGVSCIACHTKSGIYKSTPENLVEDRSKGVLSDGLANASTINEYIPHLGIGSEIWGPYTDEQVPSSPHGVNQWEFAKTDGASGGRPTDSSQLCLSCHDVRFSKPDSKTDEGFQRLENLGTEHLAYKKDGGQFSCVDCHMTQDPNCEPGVFAKQPISAVNQETKYRVNHTFLGVTTPLQTHEGRFQDTDSLDLNELGLPLGRKQLKGCLLKRAVTLKAPPRRQQIKIDKEGNPKLVITSTFSNTGAGHGVPSGFSQERQVWAKVTVKDDAGKVVFRSGYTWGDIKGKERETWAKKLGFKNVEDFNLVVNNEDLADEFVVMDPVTFEAMYLADPERKNIGKEKYDFETLEEFNEALKNNSIESREVLTPEEYIARFITSGTGTLDQEARRRGYSSFQQLEDTFVGAEYIIVHPGDTENPARLTDIIYRTGHVQYGPDGLNHKAGHEDKPGLQIFTNQFKRTRQSGEDETVFSAHLANHMNNKQSLQAGKTDETKWEFPIDPDYKGNYEVDVSLNYRSYPPHFFKTLVEGEKLRAQRQNREPIAGEQEYQNAIETTEMAKVEFSINAGQELAKVCLEQTMNKVSSIQGETKLKMNSDILQDGIFEACKSVTDLHKNDKVMNCIVDVASVYQEDPGRSIASKNSNEDEKAFGEFIQKVCFQPEYKAEAKACYIESIKRDGFYSTSSLDESPCRKFYDEALSSINVGERAIEIINNLNFFNHDPCSDDPLKNILPDLFKHN